MGPFLSVAAIAGVFVYVVTFGSAIFMGLEVEMHWGLALIAMAGIILLRLWPVLPLLAWLGAVRAWDWEWYWALLLALPVLAYIVPHYWIRIADRLTRPKPTQGA